MKDARKLGLQRLQLAAAVADMNGSSEQRLFPQRRVAVADLKPDPKNPRRIFSEEEIQGLAATIREVGLLQPLMAWRDTDRKWTLNSGERRLRAIQLLGWTEVDIIEIEEGSRAAALIENIQRVDLSPLEAANGLKDLADERGWDKVTSNAVVEQMASIVGKSQTWVHETLRLLGLPPDIVTDPLLSEISRSALVELATLPEAELRALWSSVVRSGGPLTVKMVRDFKEGEGPRAPAGPRTVATGGPLKGKGLQKMEARIDGHLASGATFTDRDREVAERLFEKLRLALGK